MPNNLQKLKLYSEHDPLFNRYQIEGQIETAFSRHVTLPSGGSLTIDHTEALTSIDINSARSTAGEDIEETAFSTNLEAADEITRQLRLRDLGGLIVIDFIDMMNNRNQREVENRLKDALKVDRARVQIGRISRFGLLEMSRQRLRPSLGESSHIPCPRCDGQGTIRGVESLALSVLRIIEEECMKEMTAKVMAKLPVDTATFLLNEKRDTIRAIEERLDVEVIIIPSSGMETPQYQVQRIRLTEAEIRAANKPSYNLMKSEEEEQSSFEIRTGSTKREIEIPAVKQVMPKQHAAVESREKSQKPGFFSRLMKALTGNAKNAPTPREDKAGDADDQRQRGDNRDRNRDRRDSGGKSTRQRKGNDSGSRRRRDKGQKSSSRRDNTQKQSNQSGNREQQRSAQKQDKKQTSGKQEARQGNRNRDRNAERTGNPQRNRNENLKKTPPQADAVETREDNSNQATAVLEQPEKKREPVQHQVEKNISEDRPQASFQEPAAAAPPVTTDQVTANDREARDPGEGNKEQGFINFHPRAPESGPETPSTAAEPPTQPPQEVKASDFQPAPATLSESVETKETQESDTERERQE